MSVDGSCLVFCVPWERGSLFCMFVRFATVFHFFRSEHVQLQFWSHCVVVHGVCVFFIVLLLWACCERRVGTPANTSETKCVSTFKRAVGQFHSPAAEQLRCIVSFRKPHQILRPNRIDCDKSRRFSQCHQMIWRSGGWRWSHRADRAVDSTHSFGCALASMICVSLHSKAASGGTHLRNNLTLLTR